MTPHQQLFDEGMTANHADALRLATNQQNAWDSEQFRLQIEDLAKRELEVRPRERRRLKEKCT